MDFSWTQIRKSEETECIEKLSKVFLCCLDDKIGDIYDLHTTEIFGLNFYSLPRSNRHIKNKKIQM